MFQNMEDSWRDFPRVSAPYHNGNGSISPTYVSSMSYLLPIGMAIAILSQCIRYAIVDAFIVIRLHVLKPICSAKRPRIIHILFIMGNSPYTFKGTIVGPRIFLRDGVTPTKGDHHHTFPWVCDAIAPMTYGLQAWWRWASQTPRGGLNSYSILWQFTISCSCNSIRIFMTFLTCMYIFHVLIGYWNVTLYKVGRLKAPTKTVDVQLFIQGKARYERICWVYLFSSRFRFHG